MIRDSSIIYCSYYEAIDGLADSSRLILYDTLMAYIFKGKEPELTGVEKAIFTLIKPTLDANNARFENGKKGGRPKQQETEPKPKANQTETKPKGNKNKNENYNKNYNKNLNKNENEKPDSQTLQALFSSSLILDEDILLTLGQYKQLSEVYQKTEWLKENFKHLSKIHKYQKRILTGYYDKVKKLEPDKTEEKPTPEYDLSEFYHS